MRIALSLTEIIGVHGCIVDNGELVAGWLLIPESIKKSVSKKLQESKIWPVMKETLNITRFNPASCFLDKERKVDGMYKGYQSLYINNKVSFKNATLDKQYFLLKKLNEKRSEEEVIAELKDQFFTKALKKLPLPINDDWKVFIWEEIKDYFKELPIYGSIPYEKAFVMELPNVDKLQQLVEFSHKSFEFKTKFNRVPQLKSIVSGVNDIEHFNFKEWQSMLQLAGGQEEFKKHSFEHQKAIVQAFEILGAHPDVLNYLQMWHSTAIKNVCILIRREKDKNRKTVIKSSFIKVFEMFKEEQNYIYAAINNFPKLFKDEEVNIRNNNIQPLKSFLERIAYENVRVGAEELSAVCSLAKVSESEYKDFEIQYLQHLDKCLTSPRSYPTIRSQVTSKIAWELLDMSIPRAWVVGIETHCCMHPHSVGGSCLVYAAQNPETSGILRVEENGKTIAQSFMWISAPDKDGKRVMVLDNIETLGRDLRESVINTYKDFVEKMEFYARVFRIKAITVGAGYSDVNLESFCIEKLNGDSPLYGKIPNTLRYYDASTQWLLKKF